MKKILSILLLLNFLVFILPMTTGNNVALQFLTTMPAEEEQGHKCCDPKEIKLFHPLHDFQFSGYLFYLQSKERFAHFHIHTPAVEWLDTFSPPPDLA